MTITRLTLAVIMVLILAPSTHVGTAMATPVYPIVAFNDPFNDSKPTGYLLGGSAGGQWIKPAAAAALIPGGEEYRLYTLTGEVGKSAGRQPAKGEDACSDTWYATLAPFPTGRGSLVAVGGPWNACRDPSKSPARSSGFIKRRRRDFKAPGIANPKVNLTQVLRVDLDGDGVEEVLVSATNYGKSGSGGGLTPDARAGDYSLVLLRKVVQGKVITTIITGEYYPSAKKFNVPAEHRVIGVLDLNGDGILEIVLSGRYYEGDWVDAYRIDGAKVIKLFSMGCGA